MSGTCIISFDCEGKWGLIDNLLPYHESHFTSLNIYQAYKTILDALEEKNFSSTFAFVGAFTMEKEHFLSNWSERLKNSKEHQVWLNHYITNPHESMDSSWFCPELIPLVRSYESQAHEICSHGFTHLSWDVSDINALHVEIEGIIDWYTEHSISSNTFIFPRNIIERKELLSNFGIDAYREKIKNKNSSPLLSRFFQLLSEFNINAKSAYPSKCIDKPIPILGEHFLNWRHGIRKLVPIKVTTLRFQSALEHAIKTNGVINLWSHPHNFISGQNQIDLFVSCLNILEKKYKQGDVQVLTQKEYVNQTYPQFLTKVDES
tara:strand:- start:385 stop:1341 length:957 start_codon:yes stop_codon:yes gene_type:complete